MHAAYGTPIPPIAVPLDPGESEAQHEHRFRKWLLSRRVKYETFDGNPNLERSERIIFAKFKTQMYAKEHRLLPNSGGKRQRSSDEEDEEDQYEGNGQYDDDGSDGDDDGDGAPRAKRRAVMYDDSTASVDHQQRPQPYSREAKNVLLRKRVLSVAQYRIEMDQEAIQKMTPQQKIKLYGTAVTPVYVPLFPSETVEMYERFLKYLASRSMTLKTIGDANRERSLRLAFARFRLSVVKGGHVPRTTESHEDQDEDDGGETTMPVGATATTGTRPSILDRVGKAPVIKAEDGFAAVEQPPSMFIFDTSTSTGINTAGTSVASERVAIVQEPKASAAATPPVVAVVKKETPDHPNPNRPRSAARHFEFPKKCLRQPADEKNTSKSAFLTRYVTCGCRDCLLRCASHLVFKVVALEEDAAAAAAKATTKKKVMDLTHEVDSTTTTPTTSCSSSTSESSSSSSSSLRGVDVAKMMHITSLLQSRRRAQRSSSTQATQSSTDPVMSDDPIEHQLMTQYDEINDRVVVNQRVLEASTAQLHEIPYDRVQEASQHENQQLRGLIDDEMDHRNAALAILVVYMWRHARRDLETRIYGPAAASVTHVQRVCHRKCATISSEFNVKQAEASALKIQLDILLAEGTDTNTSNNWAELGRLGAELTRVEAALQELYSARRREFATLLHFDPHVRELVKTLLTET